MSRRVASPCGHRAMRMLLPTAPCRRGTGGVLRRRGGAARRALCAEAPPPGGREVHRSLVLTYSDTFEFPLPEKHRFPMEKYRLVRQKLEADASMADVRFEVAPLATRAELCLVHDGEYVQRFLEGRLSDADIRRSGFPWTPAGVQRALASTGGTVEAVRSLLQCDALIAGQVAGGTHHAYSHRAEGFCIFNDLAVAAAVALGERPRQLRRVLLVDLDVHQGNGSAQIFRREPRVFTLSFHGANNYPLRKESSDLDVPLPDRCGDELFLGRLREVLPPLVDRFRPQLVFYQAGVDALESDSLGRLAMTREGLHRRNLFVYRLFLRRAIPLVVTMGGGYSRPIDASRDAHADVYLDARRCLREHFDEQPP